MLNLASQNKGVLQPSAASRQRNWRCALAFGAVGRSVASSGVNQNRWAKPVRPTFWALSDPPVKRVRKSQQLVK